MAVTYSGKDKLLKWARLFVGGYDLSGDAITFSSLDNNEEEIDLTGWSDLTMAWTITGRKILGVSGLQCFMNPATGRAFDQLAGAPIFRDMLFAFGGGGEPTTGDPVFMFSAISLADAISWDNQRATINVENLRVDSTDYDALSNFPLGRLLQGNVQQSGSWNSDSIDMEADQIAPNVGAQFQLHVLEASGTTWTFKIQDSINDSAWVDVLTFSADGSVITAERNSTNNQIDRYVRFNATAGGAGNVTVVCSFSPRVRAD